MGPRAATSRRARPGLRAARARAHAHLRIGPGDLPDRASRRPCTHRRHFVSDLYRSRFEVVLNRLASLPHPGPRMANPRHRHAWAARLGRRVGRRNIRWCSPRRGRCCRRRKNRSGSRSRRRSRSGRRRRCGFGRRWYRRQRRGCERRQKQQRIEVALWIGCAADAEVHVRNGQLGHAARADGANDIALGHRRVPGHAERAEMEQRRGVPVGGLDRQRLAARRHRSGERDRPAGWRDDRRPSRGADVDAAMEPGAVRIGAKAERAQDRSVHRPGPGACSGRGGERRNGAACRQKREERPDPLPVLQTTATVPGGLSVVKSDYSEAR
jgi:hypothetical protein